MCNPTLVLGTIGTIGIGTQIVGGIQVSQAQKAAGEANKAYYDELADMSEEQIPQLYETTNRQIAYNDLAADKNITGVNANAARDTQTIERASRSVSATQRAAQAASGIDISGSATAEDIARDTFDKAALDKLAIRYNANTKIENLALEAGIKDWELMTNADLKAQDLKRTAKSYRLAGINGVTAANIQAGNTLLSTASNVTNSTYNYLRG